MSREQLVGKGRVRIVVFEMEGGDKAISDSLATIAAALSKPPAPRPSLLPNSGLPYNGVPGGPPAPVEGTLFDDDPIVASDVDMANKPVTPRRIRRVATPNAVDLDLKAGDPSWKEFAVAKAPDTDYDRYLCCMAWLKSNLQIIAVSSGHVFTMYKAAGWPARITDFGQAFRSLKGLRLVESAGRGEFKINHLGEQRVEDLAGSAVS